MNRWILLAFAVHCSFAATAIADDYLLRLDTIGCVDKRASENKPKEAILRSIEVVARPQSRFHTKVNIGTQTLTFVGELRRTESGDFNVQFRYTDAVDTGTTVPAEDGRRKPVINTTALETSVAIAVGDSVIIGRIETQESQPDEPAPRSRIQYALVLVKCEPANK